MTESVQKLMRVRRRARTAFYIVTALGAAGLALASSTGLLRHDPEMQPLLFCASVSWSLVAGVRLAEGRIALNSRRTTYSGAQSVVGLWALVFALVAGMMTAEKIVMLLPNHFGSRTQRGPPLRSRLISNDERTRSEGMEH